MPLPVDAFGLAAQAASATAARAITSRLTPRALSAAAKVVSLGRDVVGLVLRERRQAWLGDYSLAELERRAAQFHGNGGAVPRTWWHLQLEDPNPPEGGAPAALLNLYAFSLTYQPWAIAGESVPVGATSIDRPTGAEPVQLDFTSYDTPGLDLVRYFDAKARQAVPRGRNGGMTGLVGLPADYCLILTVFHAPRDENGVFAERFRVRPVAMPRDLTNADGGPQEIALSFVQVNRFLPNR